MDGNTQSRQVFASVRRGLGPARLPGADGDRDRGRDDLRHPRQVALHTADGVKEIDVSEDHINVRASPLPFVETDTQPPWAPIGSERYKSRSLSAGAEERTGHRHRRI
jgi:hypothetical protein